ncbi:biorientation of chromosomes in cell division protein 1-like 1 isoform X2 [Ochlerotatus camptorhynchus]|uniref:biorientation of chromosomes in cell division protein 1-like 1 isoform X2 n=1 Tax=Ochlerotatus camptorhynchus TaxID=644619 RepID=UPI0031D1E135
MENLADDPSFIDAIVHEVKSQGLFDQFRKECLADVDTKPAYQNLRQRVESSVSKFLSQQKWIDNIRHKNQLREKLRRNIIESGFLETGVERIVDQVVNPKISTVFHPKVEEIVYNYLGIEKPKPIVNGSGGLDVQTDFLPEDLEAVSPDSDKKSSSTSSDLHPTMEHNAHEELNESKEHIDDFESPAFEPLETRPPSQTKHESNDSNASAISGLTSQESVENESNEGPTGASGSIPVEQNEMNGVDEQPTHTEDAVCIPMKTSPEIGQNDSQLSQVSSNSRLSIITSSEGVAQQQQQQQQEQQSDILTDPRLDITEEAQMPNFHENSNEEEGELVDSIDDDAGVSCELGPQKSNFDLRQEAYDFKGTERTRYVAVEMEGYVKERSPERQHSGVEEGTAKEMTLNDSDEHRQYTTSPVAPARYEENSSHSERSLRICEDSTLEQRVLNASDQLENCDSAKTPLNDEHSTESAPDVDKMDASQVEVVSLAAVQQHNTDKESKKDRHRGRERECERKYSSSHRQRSSSSRDDRRSHGSSKYSSSSSSRKSDHRDRKHENGNSNSNNGSSRRSHEKRKDDDDHYSAHEKSSKRRRSTDRDSNDGAENGKTAKPTGGSTVRSGESVNDSVKDSQGSDKRAGGGTQDNQDKLNDSLDSSFEGFDEEQLHDDPKKMEKITKALAKSPDKAKSREISKVSKKTKKHNHKSPKEADRKTVTSMDVFAFSFEKPSKLGKNGEMCHDEVPLPCSEMEDKRDEALSTSESIDQLEEGVIVLEPTELAKVIKANEQHTLEEETSSMDDDILTTVPHNFHQANPDDLVTLATQPVVVDQMLTNGDNMDLELLIGEKRLCGDETTLDKIQQGLDVAKNKVKKPKIASNFNEARKLMKVRRQIERDEKKKREQAMVLAKRLITENGNASEDDQGIELEFVCDGNRISSGPIISSPVRQKAKLNSSYDEEADLLYLPEDGQVYAINEKLLNFLKQRTNNILVPDDFIRSNDQLYSLDLEATRPKETSARDIFPEIENDETMTVEVLEPLNCSTPATFKLSGNPDNVDSESSKLLKMRAISIDSDHSVKHDVTTGIEKGKPNQKSIRRKHLRSPEDTTSESNVDFDECISSKPLSKTGRWSLRNSASHRCR